MNDRCYQLYRLGPYRTVMPTSFQNQNWKSTFIKHTHYLTHIWRP